MQVTHETSKQRFVVRTEGGEAELQYAEPRPGVMDLLHTFVPPESRGKGVGEALVQEALRYAREHDQRIIPSCPYVLEWLDGHPEAQELVAS